MILFNFRRRRFLRIFGGVAPVALGQDRSGKNAGNLIAVSTPKIPWKEQRNEKTGRTFYLKNLIRDAETGMEVLLIRYPAGVVTPLHTHPCAHGMYVLNGTLTTHDGHYGPGSFVWFPEGEKIEHGATSGTDVTVLFITNKRFGIKYL